MLIWAGFTPGCATRDPFLQQNLTFWDTPLKNKSTIPLKRDKLPFFPWNLSPWRQDHGTAHVLFYCASLWSRHVRKRSCREDWTTHFCLGLLQRVPHLIKRLMVCIWPAAGFLAPLLLPISLLKNWVSLNSLSRRCKVKTMQNFLNRRFLNNHTSFCTWTNIIWLIVLMKCINYSTILFSSWIPQH